MANVRKSSQSSSSKRPVPTKKKPVARKKSVVPDSIDLRDRPYLPSITVVPKEIIPPNIDIPVLNQKDSSACTGFALSSVIYHLQYRAKRQKALLAVSPYMLYSMARRYDEFPGDPSIDSGSSLRGAMKGWFKHGACAANLWRTLNIPKLTNDPESDWWLDATMRPLGAYYRIEVTAIIDMQVALNEIGALYASAVCHNGWGPTANNQYPVGENEYWEIPFQKGTPADGGHAFAIVGYTSRGFIIHNSWDSGWATRGLAVLSYDDWLANGMDCWVAQLGVRTQLHIDIAKSPSLRTDVTGKVTVATDDVLRNKEIGPFLIDMENNGRLSNTGEFRTREDDLKMLVTGHLSEARKVWKLRDNDAIDIALYAHGGLTSEKDAAKTAASWIPALYDAQIFPIFLMWETDLWSTLKNRTADIRAEQVRTTGGFWDKAKNWYNERLEKLLAVPGTSVWGEMKQNADAISNDKESGAVLLYKAFNDAGLSKDKIRLHLIGHSAGSIVHSHIVGRMKDWNFSSINFMAPAVRSDLFVQNVVPAISKGRIGIFNEFHLANDAELKDPTCEAILGYSRSLLYLVSQSFEKGKITPILGMEKFFSAAFDNKIPKNVTVYTAPGPYTHSTTHGGFDDDEVTRNKVIECVKAAR